MLSVCPELSDLRLRVNEKRTLNALNSDKNRQTIRWATLGGRVGGTGYTGGEGGVLAVNGLALLQISNERQDKDG